MDAFQRWFIATAAHATFLSLLAVTVVGFARRGTAAFRHNLWAATVIAIVVSGILTPWVPDRVLAVLPTALVPAAGIAQPTARSVAPKIEPPAALDTGRVSEDVRPSPLNGLFTVWAIGAALMAAGLIRRLAFDAWIHASAEPLRRLTADTPPIPLRVHSRIEVPILCGLFRPFIVLPDTATGWSDQRLGVVIAHECAHRRRGDQWWALLSGLACVLQWMNPLVWYVARRFDEERENACDDVVLAAGVRPSVYASELVAVAAEIRTRPRGMAIAMARRSAVEARVVSLLDPARNVAAESPLRPLTAWVCVCAISVLALPVRLTAKVSAQPQSGSRADALVAGIDPISVLERDADAAIRALAEAMRSSDYERRPLVDRGLRLRLSSPAVEAVIAATANPDAVVRELACWALGESRATSGANALARSASDPIDRVRAAALRGLGELGLPEMARTVSIGLKDRSAAARLNAAHALGDLVDPQSIRSLADAIPDRDAAVTAKAQWAIRQVVEAADSAVQRRWLTDRSPEVRIAAARALGDTREALAARELRDLLGDPDARVRRAAQWALREIGR